MRAKPSHRTHHRAQVRFPQLTSLPDLEERRLVGDDREAETAHDIAVTMRALQSSVCLGLRGESDHLYGFIAVRDDRVRDAFSKDEVQLLVGLATQVAVTVENSQLYQQMKEKDRLAALGEMAAGLAHEIRNPLTSIKLNLQSLERDVSSQKIPRDCARPVQICLREINRLDRVVRGALSLARTRSAAHELCSVHRSVEEALEALRPQPIKIDACLPVRTHGAPVRSGMRSVIFHDPPPFLLFISAFQFYNIV